MMVSTASRKSGRSSPADPKDYDDYQELRPRLRQRVGAHMITDELIEACTENVKYLRPEAASLSLLVYKGKPSTLPQLAKHVAARDNIGTHWAETLYIGTYVRLSPNQKKAVRERPKYLIELVVSGLREETDRHKKEMSQ